MNTSADTSAVNTNYGPLDGNGNISLRSAVQYADALAGRGGDAGSTIEFTQARTVTLTGPMDPFTANIAVVYVVSTAGTDDGPPPPPQPVVIQGNGTFRLFQIDDGSASSFSGSGPFDFTGGSTAGDGGAFYVQGSSASLSLTDCTIYGNSAARGGAVMNEGSLTLSACDLHTNDASGSGGALYNDEGATTTIACATEIYANTARYGGGIYVYGNSTVNVYDDSEIYGNTASMCGGGVYNLGTFTMSGGSIYSNEANGEMNGMVLTGGRGGGVYNDGTAHQDDDTNGTVGLTDVLFDGNTAASSGGGLYLEAGTATTLSSCTIQNNTAAGAAPGIGFEMGATLNGTGTCTFGDPNQQPVQV